MNKTNKLILGKLKNGTILEFMKDEIEFENCFYNNNHYYEDGFFLGRIFH